MLLFSVGDEEEKPGQKEIGDHGLKTEKAVTVFKEAITRADGELVPLPGRKSALGEELFVSARFGPDAFLPNSPYSYLNIDLFVKRGKEFIPIGIRDFEIKDGVANGNKQRHQHLKMVNEAQKAADRYWSTGEGIHVIDINFLNYAMANGGFSKMGELREAGVIRDEDNDWTKPIYQHHGYGTLMTACALLVLKDRRINEIDFVSPNPKARATWRKFGWNDERKLPVEKLVESETIDRIIKQFVT